MSSEIKFSVTVPAFKTQFLAECIDSILAQTYRNFELIIVNDASPQDIDSIVSGYDDSRIRYYKNKVGFGSENVVGNWNKCLEYANGDYIICMGDDDKLRPNCLEEYLKLIKMFPDLNLYHGMTEIIDENSKVTTVQEPRPLWESMYSLLWWRWIGRIQYIGDWLFKTETLRRNGGFFFTKFAWGSDDASAIMAAKDKGVANTYKPVFQYRVSNLTISKSTDNVWDKIEAHKTAFDYYKKILSDEPAATLDKLYWKLITANFSKYYNRAVSYDISDDIKAKPLHLTKWLYYALINKVPRKAVAYSILSYLKNKIINK